jgi:hypothetical protein
MLKILKTIGPKNPWGSPWGNLGETKKPESKSAENKTMDVISVANNQVDAIKGRPTNFDKVGTFELVGDKFTFKKI